MSSARGVQLSVIIANLHAVQREFDTLIRDMESPFIKKIMARHARTLIAAYKSALKPIERTGSLAKSFGLRSGRTLQVAVGVRKKFERENIRGVRGKIVPWKYAKFPEFGFKHRSGEQVSGKGIVGETFEEKKNDIANAIIADIVRVMKL